MSNPRRKSRRERCWANGQKRKAKRQRENEAAHAANVQRRANGEPTPWEAAKARRAAAREPKRLDYLLRQMNVEIPDEAA